VPHKSSFSRKLCPVVLMYSASQLPHSSSHHQTISTLDLGAESGARRPPFMLLTFVAARIWPESKTTFSCKRFGAGSILKCGAVQGQTKVSEQNRVLFGSAVACCTASSGPGLFVLRITAPSSATRSSNAPQLRESRRGGLVTTFDSLTALSRPSL
jgi:hypothetical protein